MLEQKITFDKFIRWTAIALITVAVFAVTNYLSSVLLPFFIAWLFAYLMYPMVKFIQYRMHVKVRALAILIAMAVVLGVVGLMIYFIIPPHDRAVSEALRVSDALAPPDNTHQ